MVGLFLQLLLWMRAKLDQESRINSVQFGDLRTFRDLARCIAAGRGLIGRCDPLVAALDLYNEASSGELSDLMATISNHPVFSTMAHSLRD